MSDPLKLRIRDKQGAVPEVRDQEYFTELAYSKAGRSRFTQDSPILADVIVHYGLLQDKSQPLDLLLTPDWSKKSGDVARELDIWLGDDTENGPAEEAAAGAESAGPHFIAYNQSVVAARLTFEELICAVVPMSGWWQRYLIAVPGKTPVDIFRDPQLSKIARNELLAGLEIELAAKTVSSTHNWEKRHWMIRQDLAWAARLFYIVQGSNIGGKWHLAGDDTKKIADYFVGLVERIARRQDECRDSKKQLSETPPSSDWIYSINRNRKIDAALHKSVATTKADAARQTFGVTGDNICWAVIDTGIDARHGAFRKLRRGVPEEKPFGETGIENRTRIKATYDFSDIRNDLAATQRLAAKTGRLLDWEQLETKLKLEVKHTEKDYKTPAESHGTHVAGILAADWRPDPTAVDPLGPPPTQREQIEPMQGLCPDIELYDLRVFKDGSGDEFAVMSALQFVRHLNQRHDKLEVHGVNLSLAMGHEVSNYACGRSPVCEECTRLVGNGVVVVAAAGNDGRSIYTTPQKQRREGYRTVSIADPGNAEAVITVGSTHRSEPHTYGVSYFSSRGPTGDGRSKPDLVAPGEKILSTVPGDGLEREDGTSQAAPHVSGAAALLMSRHRELIGDPVRIKKVLMETATDLGREHHFQGAGLVDVMRAIQSL